MSQLHKIRGCDNADRKLDVVFIHGLGGDAFKTWRHGEDDSTSWPHWVGVDFPDVGVWSLGYAASASKLARIKWSFGSGDRLTGHAMPLPRRASQVLYLMAQKGIGQRPLILVGHSLGGLLAKQVLRDSADSEAGQQNQAVSEQTRSVMFLGTPHAGSALASILHRFRAVFGSTVAVEDLRAHDAHLENLYNWYRNKTPGLGITTVTYYETLGCGRDQLTIVDSTSAHPGVGRNPVGLDEDHLTLAKPLGREAQVCNSLRELIRDALNNPRSPPASPVPPPTPAPTPLNVQVTVQAPAGTAVAVRIVYELPPRAEQYFGRQLELERLTQRLRERRNTAVVGPGGLGKTALAAEALYAIGDETLNELYPDGSIYIDLYATRANRDAIWSRLANTVAGFSFLEQAAPRTRAEEACRGRRLLLIIEGGEEADGNDGRAELANLLSVVSTETVRLLLTRKATQAVPAESVMLREALSLDDAAALLDSLSGSRLAGTSRQQLLELLAGHPLALTWAGNLLARDDEHPDRLLLEWTAAALPPLSDPTNSTHTLRWLYDRSARGLDGDTKQILAAAGLLAHAPLPLELVEVVLEGSNSPNRARAGLRALVCAGLMRIEAAQSDHWQFAHVLAYRYARTFADGGKAPLTLQIARALLTQIETAHKYYTTPQALTPIASLLDHAAELLRNAGANALALWPALANPLLYRVREDLRKRGRNDLAGLALDAGGHLLSTLPEEIREKSVWRRERAVHLSMRSQLLVLRCDLLGARRDCVLALEIIKRLVEDEPGNILWKYDLSNCFTQRGNIYKAEGSLAAAQRCYEQALAIVTEAANEEPENAQLQQTMIASINDLGDIQQAKGDLTGALHFYEKALKAAQRLAEADRDNDEWQQELSVSNNKLGGVQWALGNVFGAQVYFMDALRIVKSLAHLEPHNMRRQRELSVSLAKLGDVLQSIRDFPGARHHFLEGMKISKSLADADSDNAMWKQDLSVSHLKLGDVHQAEGDLASARQHYETGLQLRQHLADADRSNVRRQRDLMVVYFRLGDTQLKERNVTAARQHYEEALEIAHRLVETDRENAEWQQDEGQLCNRLVEVLELEGCIPEALQFAERCLEISFRLSAIDPTNITFQQHVDYSQQQINRLRGAGGDHTAPSA